MLDEVAEIILEKSEDADVRSALQLWSAVKATALMTFMAPFSVLGAYVQFELNNRPLTIMYVVATPLMFALACLSWRHLLGTIREHRRIVALCQRERAPCPPSLKVE